MIVRRVKQYLLGRYKANTKSGSNANNGESFYKLPSVALEEVVSPAPTLVNFIPSQICRPRDMVLPFNDLMALAAICQARKPKSLFEIGTFTGETTRILALNTTEDAKVWTLDLPEDDRPQWLNNFDAGGKFKGTNEESKIFQLWGHSEEFDFSPYHNSIELVFIDGDHSFESVKRDSENAMRLAAEKCLIVWDDYRFLDCHQSCKGVSEYLHSLIGTFDVRQVAGTRLAVLEL